MARSLTELRADFQHLRRWRKSVEQAQSYTFKAVITIIVSGFVGAVWLGVKVMLGKLSASSCWWQSFCLQSRLMPFPAGS